MPYVDVTFEKSGTVIKTVARVADGWNGSKRPIQFYDQQIVDFRGDITLRVAVWLRGAYSSVARIGQLTDFPSDFKADYDDQLMKARIEGGRLFLSLELEQGLPWIATSNGKPAVDWQPGRIAERNGVAYLLRHMIVVNLPSAKRGDYTEWDLLPFLPGGLVERNRRRH